jgi:hypothetical protein
MNDPNCNTKSPYLMEVGTVAIRKIKRAETWKYTDPESLTIKNK